MENGDHAGLSAEVFWIGGDDAHRLGRGLEQDVVDDRLVLQRDGGDGRRHGEDDMKIRNRQQVGLPIGQPLRACPSLAFWTVPVAAANGELTISCLMGKFRNGELENGRIGLSKDFLEIFALHYELRIPTQSGH